MISPGAIIALSVVVANLALQENACCSSMCSKFHAVTCHFLSFSSSIVEHVKESV